MTWIMALCIFSALIIWNDIARRLIKNHDVLLLLLVGLLVNSVGYSIIDRELIYFIGAGCLAFFALLPFYMKGWMGAADVKLAAVLGIWLGFELLLPVWILSVLMALIYAKFADWDLLKSWLLPADIDAGVSLSHRKFVPYGAMLCVSAILVGVHRII